MEALFGTARAHDMAGGKACGAGGGGCLLFLAHQGRREILAHALADAGARVIPFRFAFDGLTVSVEP
jgi:D-glycero-alpha-D-manno-heptose-7-phosphate kinase